MPFHEKNEDLSRCRWHRNGAVGGHGAVRDDAQACAAAAGAGTGPSVMLLCCSVGATAAGRRSCLLLLFLSLGTVTLSGNES